MGSKCLSSNSRSFKCIDIKSGWKYPEREIILISYLLLENRCIQTLYNHTKRCNIQEREAFWAKAGLWTCSTVSLSIVKFTCWYPNLYTISTAFHFTATAYRQMLKHAEVNENILKLNIAFLHQGFYNIKKQSLTTLLNRSPYGIYVFSSTSCPLISITFLLFCVKCKQIPW